MKMIWSQKHIYNREVECEQIYIFYNFIFNCHQHYWLIKNGAYGLIEAIKRGKRPPETEIDRISVYRMFLLSSGFMNFEIDSIVNI
jgi:hypothetical protein